MVAYGEDLILYYVGGKILIGQRRSDMLTRLFFFFGNKALYKLKMRIQRLGAYERNNTKGC